MAKSTIKLENGTTITVEGTVEEVTKLLAVYGGSVKSNPEESTHSSKPKPTTTSTTRSPENIVDTVALVNATKNADDLEEIEKNILDKASQVDRVLLPIFIADREFGADVSLTSNDIYKFLKEFGISMALPNVSKTLSGTAMKYVIGDSARKKGASTSYKISRKGKQYIEQVLKK